jgi:hypothetical protein
MRTDQPKPTPQSPTSIPSNLLAAKQVRRKKTPMNAAGKEPTPCSCGILQSYPAGIEENECSHWFMSVSVVYLCIFVVSVIIVTGFPCDWNREGQ